MPGPAYLKHLLCQWVLGLTSVIVLRMQQRIERCRFKHEKKREV